MAWWGSIEREPEITAWLNQLSTEQFQHVRFYVELLREKGPTLQGDYTTQLDGKLRELRFFVGRERVRISYWIAPGRRIILLTQFRKTKQRETREVARAKRAFNKCVQEGHTVGNGHDG
jgi:hypothetical protein